jgi:hypothetical protein
MASTLGRETRNVQNPALGAAVIWRFIVGYTEGSKTASPAPLPLLFLVLPLIFRQDFAELIERTRRSSGLRAFVDKFNEGKTSKNDLIAGLQARTNTFRDLTSRSLGVGISSSLFQIDRDGHVFSLSQTEPRAGIALSVKKLLKSSEKLGYWCGQLTLHEVTLILKVSF